MFQNGIILASSEDVFSKVVYHYTLISLKLRLSKEIIFTNVLALVFFVPGKEIHSGFRVIAIFPGVLVCF